MEPSSTMVDSGRVLAEGLGQGTPRLLLTLTAIGLTFIFLRLMRRQAVLWFQPWLHHRRFNLHATLMIATYLLGVLLIGLIIRLSHVNLAALTVVFGALSVGIGFGLQNIVNNFVSGVVILLERPVNINDRVILEDTEGTVVDIGIRATTLLTNEGVSVIIPNSHFITNPVVNRSLDAPRTRFKVPVNVAYGSDPQRVKGVLLEVATRNQAILRDPLPEVIFDAFGDSALKFFLWVWTESHADRPAIFRSELNFEIHEALQAEGIKVPFPQMEVHLRAEPDR